MAKSSKGPGQPNCFLFSLPKRDETAGFEAGAVPSPFCGWVVSRLGKVLCFFRGLVKKLFAARIARRLDLRCWRCCQPPSFARAVWRLGFSGLLLSISPIWLLDKCDTPILELDPQWVKEAAKIPCVSLFSGVGGLEAGASPSDPHWGSIFFSFWVWLK